MDYTTLGRTGLRVSVAGLGCGGFSQLGLGTGKSEAETRQAFVARQPMGRLGTAEEVAALAVYLASEESAFTTGTTISVDGGFSL